MKASAVFKPLTVPEAPTAAVDQARIDLGHKLFFDARVSADGTISCSSCHQAEKGGGDGLPKSIGFMGKPTPRNAPTVFNADGQIVQHWRGDRVSLEDQAERAVVGAFGNATPDAAQVRITDAGYKADFDAAFPGDPASISVKNFATAVASYERTLVTPSRFDSFLGGDDAALMPAELEGLTTFMDLGCSGCHSGALLGGQSLQRFGVKRDYWELTGSPMPDAGRFDVTMMEADRYVFKVPNLRNVENNGPYFHDGSVAALEDAVRVMGEAQLGLKPTDPETAAVVAFLHTLSAPPPANFTPPGPIK